MAARAASEREEEAVSWRRARKADMVDVADKGERELEIRVEQRHSLVSASPD